MSKKFQRKIEDFVCGHCGFAVQGDGYTNHCPKCFWSKHVDIYPGDRGNPCQGLMRPVEVSVRNDGYVLTHRCEKCGDTAHCKVGPDDDMQALAHLAETLAKQAMF
ncbi:MAG TPA: RNHCP domain-containing protein [Patescibacteria group bacterium]|nr:RNHCP domain-containing protein [Patescibacteria group bacterium]